MVKMLNLTGPNIYAGGKNGKTDKRQNGKISKNGKTRAMRKKNKTGKRGKTLSQVGSRKWLKC